MQELLTLQKILSEQPSSNLHKIFLISQGLLMLKKNNSCSIEQFIVIALFTIVIIFILCARKSRLYFAVGRKKKTLIYYFYYFFADLYPPKYFSSKNCQNNHKRVETSSTFSGHLLAQGTHESWRIEVERSFVLQYRHSDTVAQRHQLKK